MVSPGRFTVPPALVRRLALASLVANVGIVLTGGAVRLTGSGLGCPAWPRCTEGSWTATREMGIHGLVEFGNRTLTGVLGAVALAGLLAALALRPRRRSLVWLATAVLVGIGAQGALGGVTVLTDLNPWIVGGHFLVSVALIATAYAFWRRVDEPDGPVRPTVPPPLRTLAWLAVAASLALLTVGTVVTGSGPHAGDVNVPRNGLDPQVISQVHADLGFLLLGLSVASWFALRAVGGPDHATGFGAAGRAGGIGSGAAGGPGGIGSGAAGVPDAPRAAAVLVAVVLAQGAVGLVQYFTGLPELAVWFHLLGSCLVWVAALHLLYATRVRVPPPPATPPQATPTPVDHGVFARHAERHAQKLHDQPA